MSTVKPFAEITLLELRHAIELNQMRAVAEGPQQVSCWWHTRYLFGTYLNLILRVLHKVIMLAIAIVIMVPSAQQSFVTDTYKPFIVVMFAINIMMTNWDCIYAIRTYGSGKVAQILTNQQSRLLLYLVDFPIWELMQNIQTTRFRQTDRRTKSCQPPLKVLFRFLVIKTVTVAFVIESLRLRPGFLSMAPIDLFIGLYFVLLCILYGIEAVLTLRAVMIYWAFVRPALGQQKTVRDYLASSIDSHLRTFIFEVLSPKKAMQQATNRYNVENTGDDNRSGSQSTADKALSVAVDLPATPVTVINSSDIVDEENKKEHFRWTQVSMMKPDEEATFFRVPMPKNHV